LLGWARLWQEGKTSHLATTGMTCHGESLDTLQKRDWLASWAFLMKRLEGPEPTWCPGTTVDEQLQYLAVIYLRRKRQNRTETGVAASDTEGTFMPAASSAGRTSGGQGQGVSHHIVSNPDVPDVAGKFGYRKSCLHCLAVHGSEVLNKA
jgi:hypothetical protein